MELRLSEEEIETLNTLLESYLFILESCRSEVNLNFNEARLIKKISHIYELINHTK